MYPSVTGSWGESFVLLDSCVVGLFTASRWSAECWYDKAESQARGTAGLRINMAMDRCLTAALSIDRCSVVDRHSGPSPLSVLGSGPTAHSCMCASATSVVKDSSSLPTRDSSV